MAQIWNNSGIILQSTIDLGSRISDPRSKIDLGSGIMNSIRSQIRSGEIDRHFL